MKKLKQSGFSAIEGLLVFVIVGLAGFVGWYVYNQHKNNSATVPTTTSTSTITSTPPVIPSANIAKLDVEQLLTTFYTKYTAVDSSAAPTADKPAVTKQYGTSKLVTAQAKSTGQDNIVCAQNIPTSFSVSGITTTTTSASAEVTEVFGSGNVKIKVGLVKESGKLWIDSVTCPAS